MFAAIWSIEASSGCGETPGGANWYWSAPCKRRDRHLRGRERRMQRRVEREPLNRVVRRADLVEVAAEPAGAQVRVGLAHLVVVAGREVRLVGVVVADRLDHGDLALGVQRREPAGARMPAQPLVLGERRARASARSRASAAASSRPGSPAGKSTRKGVDPAVQEDRDEHLLVRRRVGRRLRRCRRRARALESALPP